jgi:hypothetical protein
MLLIGASIWTVLIKKSEAVNDFVIGPNNHPVPLGIVVSVGSGLYMIWAAFACMLISIVPYMVRCVISTLFLIPSLWDDFLNTIAAVHTDSVVDAGRHERIPHCSSQSPSHNWRRTNEWNTHYTTYHTSHEGLGRRPDGCREDYVFVQFSNRTVKYLGESGG